MARPKKEEHEGLSDRITIRYPVADLNAVRTSANSMGLTVAEFIRQRSVNGTARPNRYRKGIDPALITEINELGVDAAKLKEQSARLGNVAMQIVRATNFDGRPIPNSPEWQQLHEEIKKNQQAIAQNQKLTEIALEKVLAYYD